MAGRPLTRFSLEADAAWILARFAGRCSWEEIAGGLGVSRALLIRRVRRAGVKTDDCLTQVRPAWPDLDVLWFREMWLGGIACRDIERIIGRTPVAQAHQRMRMRLPVRNTHYRAALAVAMKLAA